jgi:uncharacterized protein (TIGR03083 family)
MKPLEPIYTLPLFPDERAALLDLLAGLTPDEWHAPTICAGWSVKDIAGHLIGDDMGLLSGRRDGYHSPDGQGVNFADWDELITFINRQNDTWVRAMRRISPRVVIDWLRISGEQTQALFESLDMDAIGGTVNWVSAQPGPVWMELAREYTERWTHQQHIRDAVNQPGLKDQRRFGPVLDAFSRALPRAYTQVDAPPGTIVACIIRGEAGGAWTLRREQAGWAQYVTEAGDPPADSTVTLDQEAAWRLFTKGINRDAALRQITIAGRHDLGLPLLDTVSMLV